MDLSFHLPIPQTISQTCNANHTTSNDIMCTVNTTKEILSDDDDLHGKTSNVTSKKFRAVLPYKKIERIKNKRNDSNNMPVTDIQEVIKSEAQKLVAAKLLNERAGFYKKLYDEKLKKDRLENYSATLIQAIYRGYQMRPKNRNYTRKISKTPRFSVIELRDELCYYANKINLKPIPGLSLGSSNPLNRKYDNAELTASKKLYLYISRLVQRKRRAKLLRQHLIDKHNSAANLIKKFIKRVVTNSRRMKYYKEIFDRKILLAQSVCRSFLAKNKTKCIRENKILYRLQNDAAIIIQRSIYIEYKRRHSIATSNRLKQEGSLFQQTYKAIVSDIYDKLIEDGVSRELNRRVEYEIDKLADFAINGIVDELEEFTISEQALRYEFNRLATIEAQFQKKCELFLFDIMSDMNHAAMESVFNFFIDITAINKHEELKLIESYSNNTADEICSILFEEYLHQFTTEISIRLNNDICTRVENELLTESFDQLVESNLMNMIYNVACIQYSDNCLEKSLNIVQLKLTEDMVDAAIKYHAIMRYNRSKAVELVFESLLESNTTTVVDKVFDTLITDYSNGIIDDAVKSLLSSRSNELDIWIHNIINRALTASSSRLAEALEFEEFFAFMATVYKFYDSAEYTKAWSFVSRKYGFLVRITQQFSDLIKLESKSRGAVTQCIVVLLTLSKLSIKLSKINDAKLYLDFCLKLAMRFFNDSTEYTIFAVIHYHIALWYLIVANYHQAEISQNEAAELISYPINRSKHDEIVSILAGTVLPSLSTWHVEILLCLGRIKFETGLYVECANILKKIFLFIEQHEKDSVSKIRDSVICECLKLEAQLQTVEGNFLGAEETFEELISMQISIHGDSIHHEDVLLCKFQFIRLLLLEGKFQYATTLAREIIAVMDELASPEEITFLNAEYFYILGQYHVEIGILHQALECLEKAKKYFSALFSEHHLYISNVMYVMWQYYMTVGWIQQADAILDECMQIRLLAYMDAEKRGHLTIVQTKMAKALVMERLGKFIESKKIYDQVIPTLHDLVSNLNITGTYAYLEICKIHMCRLFIHLGLYEQVKGMLRDAGRMLTEIFGDYHPIVIEGLFTLGRLCTIKGKYLDAKNIYDHCFQLLSNLHEVFKSHPTRIAYLLTAMENFLYPGNYEEAKLLAHETMEIINSTSSFEGKGLHVAFVYYYHGQLYRETKMFDDAIIYYHKAMHYLSDCIGKGNAFYGLMMGEMGECQRYQGKFSESKATLNQAFHLRKLHYGDRHSYVGETLLSLSMVIMDEGNYLKAEEIIDDRVLPIIESIHGPEHPITMFTWGNLVMCHLSDEELEELGSETVKTSVEADKQLLNIIKYFQNYEQFPFNYAHLWVQRLQSIELNLSYSLTSENFGSSMITMGSSIEFANEEDSIIHASQVASNDDANFMNRVMDAAYAVPKNLNDVDASSNLSYGDIRRRHENGRFLEDSDIDDASGSNLVVKENSLISTGFSNKEQWALDDE